MSISSTFNKQLINFYNELENLNIDKKLLSSSKNKIILLKKANSKMLIQLFITHIYIYKNYIINNDDTIFDSIKLEEEKDNKIYILFNILKDNWNKYSEDNKNNIWLYLNVLIKLCDQYIEKINLKNI